MVAVAFIRSPKNNSITGGFLKKEAAYTLRGYCFSFFSTFFASVVPATLYRS